MKKISKSKKSIHEPLNDYERQLIKDIEDDVFVPVPNQEEEIKKLRSYAANYLKKDKRVTLRVTKKDLEKIQEKAIESGIPYQTLINSLIRQYANGRISINV